MNLYISDIHFGHRNIIRLDERPFENEEEMDRAIIDKWNQKVSPEDHIYIVGDIAFRNTIPVQDYLKQLKGHKHLILGNHDGDIPNNQEALSLLESVDDLLEINEGDRKICLCHYPLADWNGRCKGSWLIYGHIHAMKEAPYEYMKTQERALNAAVCINQYEPVTFDELCVNNMIFQGRF